VKEEGRRKKEEGRRKKEEGRRKKEEFLGPAFTGSIIVNLEACQLHL
jgi:hypothetical protein